MPQAVTSILPAQSPEAGDRWKELSHRCDGLGAFEDFHFVKGLAEVQSIPCEVLFVSDANVDGVGLLLPYRRLGPFREVILPRFCPTTPALVPRATAGGPNDLFAQALASVADRYHRAGIHLADDRARLDIGTSWSRTPLYTYRFDLRTLEPDVTAGWSAGTRRIFRRHADAYRLSEDVSRTRAAVDLCSDSYERSGRPLPVSATAMADFAQSPPGDATTRTFLATPTGENDPDAAIVTLHHGETAFYWIAGSRPGPGMTVLVGRVLQVLRDEGVRTFDFLGANTPSIAEFKRRFGPSLHEYARISTSRSRLLDLVLRMRGQRG